MIQKLYQLNPSYKPTLYLQFFWNTLAAPTKISCS